MTTLICPVCDKSYRVRNKDIVGRATCPHCSRTGAPVVLVELPPPQEPALGPAATGGVLNEVLRVLGLALREPGQ